MLVKLESVFGRGEHSSMRHSTYIKYVVVFLSALFALFIMALIVVLISASQNGGAVVESPGHVLSAGEPSSAVQQSPATNDSQKSPENQPAQPTQPALSGWQIAGGERYYYQADGTRVTGTILINGAYVHFDEQGRWQSTYLEVPYISQLPDMPSGCEVVSVTMMLNYAGVDVTKEDVAERLPYADDPEFGFTGSLYDDGYYWEGGIIWPSALLDLVRDYTGTAVDLTESPWSAICGQIDAGRPVCVWFGSEGMDHTVLLTGYSATEVWLNDPLDEENSGMSLDWFMFYWEQNGYRALSY